MLIDKGFEQNKADKSTVGLLIMSRFLSLLYQSDSGSKNRIKN